MYFKEPPLLYLNVYCIVSIVYNLVFQSSLQIMFLNLDRIFALLDQLKYKTPWSLFFYLQILYWVETEIGWSDRDRRSFTIMKEYGLYHFKKCWFKTHIVLFFPFWALCEKGSCVGYICIVWSILMINTSMASKEVRLLSKEEGRKESSIGLLSTTYYLVLWEAIIWKSPSPPTSPSY